MSDVDGERVAAELVSIRKLLTAMGARVAVAAVSFEDAAVMLSCSPRHIGRMVKRGILRPREIGGLREIVRQRCVRANTCPARETSLS